MAREDRQPARESGMFPNERAIRRLVVALLLDQNDEYAILKH